MELYERLCLDKINYLNKLTFDEFKPYCSPSCKNEAKRKVKYEMLKNFCKINIKAKGEVRRLYAYTLVTPNEVGGRLYSGNSIQGLSRKIRGFLCGGKMTDIDMKNCHPTIARWLCKKAGIMTPMLDAFINNRDQICERFGEGGKQLFLAALNDENLNKKIKDDFFKSFDKECKMIQSKINALPEYQHIAETTPEHRLYNWNGSAFNRIMCVYENKILQDVISVINKRGIEIAVLMFDGLMVYGDLYKDESLLREIETVVGNNFSDLNMKFSYKEHDDEMEMPENQEPYDEDRSNDDCYDYIKKEFEKTHCKIINKAMFIKKHNNDLIMMSKTKLMESYQNKKYVDYSDKEPKKCSFITRWLQDEYMLSYDDVAVYPPPLKCPENEFNLWLPFDVSLHKDEYVKDEEGLAMILNHIKILCGNDDNVNNYFIKWIAQMFQYPGVKTIIPHLIGEQGCGKGSLTGLLSAMMGASKYTESPNPSREIWGHFNGLMADTFLINLNEMCKKEAQEAEGKIKSLTTDPTLQINKKGMEIYIIKSFHRFLITSNEEEPMKIKGGDRRNVAIRSSDEKVGDSDYFTKIKAKFAELRTQRTFYDYLMEIKDMDKFGSIPRPETEWQKDNKSLHESIYLRWVRAMTIQYEKQQTMRFEASTQLEEFKAWCKKEGDTWEINAPKLALNIKRLKIPGVQSSVREGSVYKTVYDIAVLKKYFGIGLLINV